MTGAMFIAHCLKQEGVTKVFGQCGHTNYALIDACHKLGIEYVSFRHEQQAAHAADAYFRVSHRLAVRQRAPVAGHDQRDHRRRSPPPPTRRRCWSSAATRRRITTRASRTRASASTPTPRRETSTARSASASGAIDDAKFLPDVMPRALNVAQTGRPGAVLLDVPMDVFSQQITVEPVTVARRPNYEQGGRRVPTASRPPPTLLARRLGAARSSPATAPRCRTRRRNCCEVAELLSIPVATTLMAKGIFPEDHALSLGMTGIWGTRVANETARARRRDPRRRHRLRRGRLQLVEPEVHLRDPAVEADSDRHRSAGDRQDLSGRRRHRRRREGDAARAGAARCARARAKPQRRARGGDRRAARPSGSASSRRSSATPASRSIRRGC